MTTERRDATGEHAETASAEATGSERTGSAGTGSAGTGRSTHRPAEQRGRPSARPRPAPTTRRSSAAGRVRARAGADPGPVRRALARSAGCSATSGPWPRLAALALAVVLTWPTLRHPLYTMPQDIWDPSLQAWQIAWAGHALRTDPASSGTSTRSIPEQ